MTLMTEKEILDKDTLHDYVVAHGFGAPSDEGYKMAERLWEYKEYHGNYSDVAFSIVSSAKTVDLEAEDT